MTTKPESPFAKLAALRDALPPGKAPPVDKPEKKGPARAVVRLERKGRGGKEATLIEKLDLSPTDLDAWCRDLKRALGCGGAVDGETIVLTGDLRRRVEPVLLERGVRKITQG